MWNKLRLWLFIPGLLALAAAVIRYSLELQWGVLESSLSTAGLFILVVATIINRREVRTFYKRRSTVYLTFSIVSSIVMLGILFLVNFIAWLHPKKFDLTEKKFFTLSEQTVKVVTALDDNVKLLGFYRENEQDWQLTSLLKEYASLNRRFSYRFIDPDREPQLTQDYGVNRYKTIILEGGGRRLRVEEPTESSLTNTLVRLIQRQPKSVYFLTGHAEHDIDSQDREGYHQARKALEEANYEVRIVNLSQESEVPADCAALVIASARSSLSDVEIARLQSYMDRSGSLLLLLDPLPAVGFSEFLLRYGIRVGEDVAIDASGASRMISAGPDTPYIQNYPRSEILPVGFPPTFYPRARTLSPTPTPPAGFKLTPLVFTSQSSWGETELGAGGGGVRYDEDKDLKGPLALAVQVQGEPAPAASGDSSAEKKPAPKLVCFGDSDFATNIRFNVVGNGDLFLNSINWLAGRADIIAIRPKKADNKRLDLSARSNTVIFYICVLLLPAIPMAAGIRILIRRFR